MAFKYKRTDMCGELSAEDIDREVVLNGWVSKQRDLGSLIFIDIRDTTGISQIVIKNDNEDLFKLGQSLRGEYVIAVKGIVKERQDKNPEMKTGDIEVITEDLKLLSKSDTPPIYVKEDDNAQEDLRLKYRYLDLRKKSLQDNLKARAKICKIIRDFFTEKDFLELETPFLTNPTPEGARDYLVPSRVNKHRFYALPQSPQQLKQISMIAGLDRYFQIVKCFRDEDLRANRQPEFTQVDMEMSFVDSEDIIDINEELICRLFKEIKDIDLERPFPRMTYDEAMARFGVDKPDLRFAMELKDLADVFKDSDFKVFTNALEDGGLVKGFNIGKYAGEYSRKKIDKLTDFVKDYGAKGLIWIKFIDGKMTSSIKKFLKDEEIARLKELFNIDDEGLIFIVSGPGKDVNASLGNLRNKIAKDQDAYEKDFAITWVTDFPMFEYSEEEDRFIASHHPFTQSKEEDIDKLRDNPEEVYSDAYDIVINGDEIGGGSIRISDPDLQNEIFEVLNLSDKDIEERFGYFIEALKYGAPPHGGLAYGLDRLVMTLLAVDNIKDVIAFPKTQSATCPLTGAPSEIDEKQLKEIHISLD